MANNFSMYNSRRPGVVHAKVVGHIVKKNYKNNARTNLGDVIVINEQIPAKSWKSAFAGWTSLQIRIARV